MKHRTVSFIILLSLLFGAPAALAQSPDEDEPVYAIQNRIFDRHHEIGLAAGFVPNDDYFYAYPLGFNYIFNLDEHLAWEVVRGQWIFNNEKDVKSDLEDDFGVTPTEFDELNFTVHSNLIWKPSYGKDALWNKKVVNHETYLLAGAGLVNYDRKSSSGEQTSENALSLSFGLGRKYFLNEKFCVNLEFRDLLNFKEDGTDNLVYLGVGLGYRFDLAPRQPVQKTSVDNFKRYLRANDQDK
ncbi:MAG: hypothetical protein C0617_11525 [Desulfuromonas sp.]|uniref:outer membrane beta-barrel domain-containing protein n=1 Tax=Desulfuromonas sp. TaxID=892 RepID=UPI000CCA3451|nr:outer membrane beta-barrel domain-containing protein [Desulfuromonas sp.]PLX83163.1 MAG: hypothetical protein C0617_11525 [Desulfuromonas sp.]